MTTYTKIIASIAIAAFAATASFAQQDYDPIMVAALAAASSEQQVKTDYDRSTSFSKYKTYSWEKVQTQDPLWVDRIKEAVDSALTAQGLRLVKSGGDIAIVAVEMTKTRQNLNTFYSGFGGGWRWGGGFGDATTRSEPWLSICSTPRPRRYFGVDRPVTLSQTNPTRTSRTLTRGCRRCSIIFHRT